MLRSLKISILTGVAILFASLVLLGGQPTFQVCHVPPGNPGNAHWIEVGAGAVSEHLANHGAWVDLPSSSQYIPDSLTRNYLEFPGDNVCGQYCLCCR